MPSLQVITTFPQNRWDVYAKRMLQSHIDYWPDDVKITDKQSTKLETSIGKIKRIFQYFPTTGCYFDESLGLNTKLAKEFECVEMALQDFVEFNALVLSL